MKTSKDMSGQKIRSGKKKSVTDKTAAAENPANGKKPSKVDEKFAAFIRKNGETPPDNFDADFKAHIFGVGEVNGYVLSKTKPAMGIIGCLNSDDDPKTWTFTKAKDSYQIGVVQAKEVKMLNIFNKARTATLAECDDTESEAVDVVGVEQVDQADVRQSNEPTNDGFETTVSRLSALLVPYYDLVRKSEAKRLGIRVSTLDKAVANENIQINAIKTMGPSLLSDVHEIVTSLDFDQISSTALISELCPSNNKHWSFFNRGDRISPKQLAHILNLYGIKNR
jgi:hypothetical protein